MQIKICINMHEYILYANNMQIICIIYINM